MNEQTQKLVAAINNALVARRNCENSGNDEWQDRWARKLEQYTKHLPSGSGIDAGSTIDMYESESEALVLRTQYHHMNDNGFYDGWTDHKLTIQPTFSGGLQINIEGEDRNDIHDYLVDTFNEALSLMVTDYEDGSIKVNYEVNNQ